MRRSQFGREYTQGKALSEDFRTSVVTSLKTSGAIAETGFIPRGELGKVSKMFNINSSTVKRIWLKYCKEGVACEGQRGGRNPRKFSEDDFVFIEACLREKPTTTYKEIVEKLKQFSPTPDITEKDISNAVLKFLPSGRFTFKKITRMAKERFTAEDMQYTQRYIDFVSQINPRKVTFFDESGFKTTVGHRFYGHSKYNERAIELGRFIPNVNITLNLFVSLDGPAYFNFVDGPSNAQAFLNFWAEASETFTPSGVPAIEPGDVIIVDNCSIHKYQAEIELTRFFNRMMVTYFFLPTYSPDLNPAERCFNKLKLLLKQQRYHDLVQNNLKVAVGNAIQELNAEDLCLFYKCTGCFNV